MKVNLENKLVVSVASRALFDLDEAHQVYEAQGLDAYQQYQIQNEDNILQPGVAFNMVQKFLNLKDPNSGESLVEVILLSRNSADTGLRVFNSIQHYDLNISRAAFTSGNSPYRYIQAFGSELFLSANPGDVARALQEGCAAATIFPAGPQQQAHKELRVAFDGDAVIFSDEAELVFQQAGLDAFQESEAAASKTPLPGGPLHAFLKTLHGIQNLYPADDCPIRTALVTARNAPAHERVIRTLRSWNIRIDEAIFLGGVDKGEFLKAFAADFYFDDQSDHCESTSQHVATGHVPHGIINDKS